MIHGYARVSTQDQNLAGQIEALTAAGAESIFQEKVSGARADRPQLRKMISGLQKGDLVIITGIDRLARSSRDLHNILHEIEERGARFRSLRESWADTTTPQGRLFISILAALAEMERELIKARTGEGRRRAKEAGKSIGGPKPKLDESQRDCIAARLAAGESCRKIARDVGVSKDTVSKLRPAA